MSKNVISTVPLSLLVLACGGPAAGPPLVTNHGGSAEPSVREVDWLNRTYQTEAGPVQVTGGEHEWAREDDDRGYVHISPPVFGDVTRDGVEEALILMLVNLGGTGQFTGIDVYTMRGGTEQRLGSIPGGDRGDGGIAEVTIQRGAIVVERFHSLDTDGACCPSKLQHERWTWTGRGFAEDEAARTLTDAP